MEHDHSSGTPADKVHDAYARLAGALDALPNGYPRTASGIELLILKKLFSAEEAAVGCVMSARHERPEEIAPRAGLSPRDTRRMLAAMARKGLVWPSPEGGKLLFRLAPFIVGIFESSHDLMDHELAHLFEDYMRQGGAAGIMKPQPALHRVVPARGSVKTEWILPYDDVKAIILAAKSFNVGDCICRVQQDKLGGRECRAPIHNCLSFSATERPPRPDDITREQAMGILDQAEEIGLVHTVSNFLEGLSYVCNCCGCCCGILRGVTTFGIKESVARASYLAAIDPDRCNGCGVCAERCQVGAIAADGGAYAVKREACIGCGLCVTGCAAGAAALSLRPDAQQMRPPSDFTAWEKERLRNRGPARDG
jgi:Na+-translocating ferredoxin:NAD+ oxidoreductase subunit B